MKKILVFLLVIFSIVSQPGLRAQPAARAAAPSVVLIKAGRLVDVRAGRALENQGILAENDRIKVVGSFADVRLDARVFGYRDVSAFGLFLGIAVRKGVKIAFGTDDMGAIEAGKYADIIAVAGDPLRDVTEFERVRFVMKGGQVARNELGR